MAKYEVKGSVEIGFSYTVEANSRDEAEDIAMERFNDDVTSNWDSLTIDDIQELD